MPAGEWIFYGLTGLTALLLLGAYAWCFLLGMRVNRPTSGDMNMFRARCSIRGTVEDTRRELERRIPLLYSTPLESTGSANILSFRPRGKQSFREYLLLPVEQVIFAFSSLSPPVVDITYTAWFKRFRRRIMLCVFLFLSCVSVPACTALEWFVWHHVLPAFAVQGDAAWVAASAKRRILYLLQAVHVLWPPYLGLFLYGAAVRRTAEEYARICRNVEVIE